MPAYLAGVDLAWHSAKNTSAIAYGSLKGNELTLVDLDPEVRGISAVLASLTSRNSLAGIAIDAPLIIENAEGQRDCEKQLGRIYGGRGASCHASNATLYPAASSVRLSGSLAKRGFGHLHGAKWQIECYPHPAIIEIFGLERRLAYKKGRVEDKRAGQIELLALLERLAESEALSLNMETALDAGISKDAIGKARGRALKVTEDTLDSIVCLYIAGLFALASPGHLFGAGDHGYIWVPTGQKIL